MRKINIILLLSTAISLQAAVETHVFWYKALENGYGLSDNPGPNLSVLPENVHQGSLGIVTIPIGGGNIYKSAIFYCFSPVETNRPKGIIYCQDINKMKGIIQSAVLRAEYLDNYILDGNFSTCQAGNMEVVWGVLDLYSICQSQLNLIDSCSLADWPGCWVFNYAREPVRIDTVNMVTSQGMNSGMTEHPLAKTFIEIDITNEVEYIISNCDTLNSHAYAIYYEVLSGTGVAETYGFTNCSELEWWQTYPESWTRDGNTTHIVVEGDLPKNPDVGIVKNPAAFDGLSLSQNNPNPFNPTTTIRYNVPSKDKGMLSIYTVQGKLVLAKEVSGRGAFQWDARGLGSGVYVYKLKTGGRVVSKRALFVR